MSEKKDTVRVSQVMAAAMAAVTAAVLGSTMGVAGTVVGAALASVVSSVGGALYLRSIQRTKDGVRTVTEKVVARAGTTKVSIGVVRVDEKPTEDAEAGPAAPVATGAAEETATDSEVESAAEETATEGKAESEAKEAAEERPPKHRPFGWPAVVAGSVLAFVLGMLVITGVEWIKGEPLSGGSGTTFGEVVQRGGGNDAEQQAPETPPATTSTSTTPSTETVTESPSAEPTTSDSSTTSSTTTTTPPSSDSSQPTEPETTPQAP